VNPPRSLTKQIFIICLLFSSILGFAQFPEFNANADVKSNLQVIADSVLHHPDASVRWKFHEILLEQLEMLLWEDPDGLSSLADSLPTLSILSSKDHRIVLVSWVVPNEDNIYNYGGILRFEKGNNLHVQRLTGQSETQKALYSRMLHLNEWYGALYYDIIQKGRGKSKHYVILGWDQFTPTANRKIIDGIRWHEELEQPVLEAPLEDAKGNEVSRMIFGYREDASMSLRYHPKEKRLVWDHLTPIRGAPAGMADFMVPDFSYDGLKYKRGRWRFLENIAPENERE